MIVDACPRCKSINNIVSDTRYRMKYKCNWCGDRFTTPAQVDIPFDPPRGLCQGCGAIEDAACTCDLDHGLLKKKEDYWFDREAQDSD